MTNEEQLVKLRKQMEDDQTLPLREGAQRLVFGEGNPDTKIYFLGEAPGYWEDQKGRPFVGQAGQLLNELLEGINLKRAEVYISNVVRFRPPQNRDPLPEELSAFAPYVDAEIEIIDPKLIVSLGRFSMAKFLPGEKISQVHGKARVVTWKGKSQVVLPMYHPAAALRSLEIMKQIKEDFKKIPEILNKAPEKEPEKPKLQQLSLI